LLVAGCGGPNPSRSAVPTAPSAASASGARVETPAPTTAPTCSASSPTPLSSIAGTRLAIERLQGSGDWVVRDISDLSHPTTLASIEYLWPYAVGYSYRPLAQIVISGKLTAVVDRDAPAPSGGSHHTFEDLVEVSLNDQRTTTLVTVEDGTFYSIDWSRDGDTWTYLLNTPSALEWHLVQGASDRIIASLPHVPGFGADATQLFRVGFSTDGQFVAMSATYLIGQPGSGSQAPIQVRRLDGSLVASSTDSITFSQTFSNFIWVGSSLYFADKNGIELWTQSRVQQVLPGVHWIRPKLSPDGTLIVYHALDPNGLPHVFAFEPASGAVKQLSCAGGAEGWFLNSRYVWYQQERTLVSTDTACDQLQYCSTGKNFVVDVTSGVETQSDVGWIADVWPRFSSS